MSPTNCLRFFFAVFLLISIFNICPTFAQVTTSEKGIQFETGEFKDALAKAKSLNKSLFVEIYLKGCPHCDALVPILEENRVGDFYNASFVSWKAEANSKESKTFQKESGITYPEFPMFFFFDADGNLIHVSTSKTFTNRQVFIQEMIKYGKTALDPAQRTASYPSRFDAGDRDVTFLIAYGKYSRAIKDLQKSDMINEELGKVLVQPQDITSQAGFFVLSRLMTDYSNRLTQYFFHHLDEFKTKYGAKAVKETGETILYHALYRPGGKQFTVDQIVTMRNDMINLGVPETDAAARLLIKELDAYMRDKNTAGAITRYNAYRKQIPGLELADYAYMLKYFNEKATDNTYLSEMPEWADAGVKAAKKEEFNSKIMAGLYLELSEAYHRMSNKTEAKKYAALSLSTAKAANENLTKYNQQIAKVK